MKRKERSGKVNGERERITRWKVYQRPTETKTQKKARIRYGGKDYKRKRKVNTKVYPNTSVERLYQRPKRSVTRRKIKK